MQAAAEICPMAERWICPPCGTEDMVRYRDVETAVLVIALPPDEKMFSSPFNLVEPHVTKVSK